VDQQREQLVGDLVEAAAPGKRDQVVAAPGLLGRVGSGAGVEQGQPVDPLGGLAEDLEGDVATHRQPGQREPARGGGKDAARDGGHGVVGGDPGDGHRPESPQRRELLGVQPR
jgi:hypothetical protein